MTRLQIGLQGINNRDTYAFDVLQQIARAKCVASCNVS